VYVQAVMTASVIYHLMALDLEPWFFQAVDKLRRGFFWAGCADANGGNCTVARHQVCQPKVLGGLGFHNLRHLNTALRTRWIWLQKTDTAKLWCDLELGASVHSRALFNASVVVSIGSGTSIKCWVDPWIGGLDAESIAPELMKHVRPSVKRTRTVADGLPEHEWVRDISGELTLGALRGHLKLWGAIQDVQRLGIDEANTFQLEVDR
jgi:hypothetical protein